MLSPKRMVRTRSPYFSPNSAMAPCAWASAMETSRCSFSCSSARIWAFTSASTAASSSGVILAKWLMSKRSRSGATKEPFCSTCVPRCLRKAWCSRWVALWLRMVERRRSASTRAMTGNDGSGGSALQKCTISSFSRLVSSTSTRASPCTSQPVSPT